MKVVLLGSVNPVDFDLDGAALEQLAGLQTGRSVPVSDLAITLAGLGHEVTIIGILSGIRIPLSFTTLNGVKLVYVPGRSRKKIQAMTFYRAEIKLIRGQIAEERPDIVHAHWTYEYALAVKNSGFAHIVTVHDDPWRVFMGFRNFYFFLRLIVAIRVSFKNTKNYVYVSEYLRRLWHRNFFAVGGDVIPNMNRLEIVDVYESSRLNRVISVSNNNRQKNIRGLLVAWQIVSTKNPQLQLHLVGPGLDSSGRLAQEFGKKFQAGQVTWHGSITRSELSLLYGRCNVLVHSSKHESFGLVYLEAFAGNLGIIAFEKAGSTAEVVGDAGLILSSDSPEILAEAILELSSNQKLQKMLTRNGRMKLESYSPDLIAHMYLSLYEKKIGAFN